jgi:hypothetical protein
MSGAPTPAYVRDGHRCIGFLLRRDKARFEAFDTDCASLGTFPIELDAANAVTAATEIAAVAEQHKHAGEREWP